MGSLGPGPIVHTELDTTLPSSPNSVFFSRIVRFCAAWFLNFSIKTVKIHSIQSPSSN